MRSKGEGVPLHLRPAFCLSALPALAKEAGGGGKTVAAKVFALWAHVQAGWQPPDLRSCRTSGGAPRLMSVVVATSEVEQVCLRICFICFHSLFPETFATVKISFGVCSCVIPSLRVAQTMSGFHRVAQPLALCKVAMLRAQD